jgi:hypothetical protein
MGLKLRYNLFYGVEAEGVYDALESFWTQHGHQILISAPLAGRHVPSDGYQLYQSQGGWTLLDWDIGWEWTLRRQAQLHVARALGCAGLLVFVYDGNYWGYELFNDGRTIDQFVQDPDEAGWFPDRACSGQPELFVAQFPALGLHPDDVASYLLPMPDDWDMNDVWDSPARKGDQFGRGDECAVIDFLRMLGVEIELRDGYVTPMAAPWRRFAVTSGTSRSD